MAHLMRLKSLFIEINKDQNSFLHCKALYSFAFYFEVIVNNDSINNLNARGTDSQMI